MKHLSLRILVLFMLVVLQSVWTYAQPWYLSYLNHTKLSATKIKIYSITNPDKDHEGDLYIGNEKISKIGKGATIIYEATCSTQVTVHSSIKVYTLWMPNKNESHSDSLGEHVEVEPVPPKPIASLEQVVEAFQKYLSGNNFYSDTYIEEIEKKIKMLRDLDDAARNTFITSHQLNGFVNFVNDVSDSIGQYKNGAGDYIDNYLNSENYCISDKESCRKDLLDILKNKHDERQVAIDSLKEELDILENKNDERQVAIDSLKEEFPGHHDRKVRYQVLNYIIAGVVLLVLAAIIVALYMKKRRMNKAPTVAPVSAEQQQAANNIVVRRKTTSILKPQNIDDVRDNNDYMKIDCAEFADGTAVSAIYIKYTCVNDIYNMYANDLRNTDNPKEDGCMVLGRWLHDEQTGKYDVTLEEIVMPGDDAIFQEYELNFGGKIKLKVAERLRSLRREKNLQYDMTCWVHSHPGLGVFFSNADNIVHMQLKHPTHPKFLTAFVVDILTNKMDMGIFTFKDDMSILSKPDLKCLYSLDEMHRWAVECMRKAIDTTANYCLTSALKDADISDVYMTHGAIIDVDLLVNEPSVGLAGWAHGHSKQQSYLITEVTKNRTSVNDDTLACLVVGTHRSLPTIRKALTDDAKEIKFVFFYSITNETLTAIPVVDGQLSMDEKCYGENKLSDLITWTRRRR